MHRLPAFSFALLGLIVGAVLFVGFSIVLAWTGPTQTAPNGNVEAPINVGTTDQVKNAGLGINSLAVFGNAILSGSGLYLNFGTTAGSAGYGIRDNAGTIELKNNGGSWASISSTITSSIQSHFADGSSNTVGQVKFTDGTTQTTAAVPGGTTQQTTVSCTANGLSATSCTTANCPSGYVRSGCSAADASTGSERMDMRSVAPSGTAACV